MSLTSGVQAAAASPVAAQFAIIDSVLTAAGWTQLTQKSAATMGTTDVVEVFVSPATTVLSNVYTGLVLFIETDETNNRMRFRVTEIYDSAATGSPATNVKNAVPGNTASTATTPDASNANHSGSTSYIALFQAAAATQAVAWANIPMSDSGFDYYLGANADTFFYTNNSTGTPNTVVIGHLQYMGDLYTSIFNSAVYMACGQWTTTTGTMSWTTSGATSNTGLSFGVRYSRQGDQAGVSNNGAFNGLLGGPMLSGVIGPGSSGADGRNTAYGGPMNPHSLYTSFLAFPAWIHGVYHSAAATSIVFGASQAFRPRTNLAIMPEFKVHLVAPDSNDAAAFHVSLHPAWGDTVDLDGTTYLSVGLFQKLTSNTTIVNGNVALLVDGSQF